MSSPLKFQQLTNYTSTKKSLLNTNAHLRDLHNETSKGGQMGINREMKREESADHQQTQPCSWRQALLGEGRKPLLGSRHFLLPEGANQIQQHVKRGIYHH